MTFAAFRNLPLQVPLEFSSLRHWRGPKLVEAAKLPGKDIDRDVGGVLFAPLVVATLTKGQCYFKLPLAYRGRK